MTGLISVGFLHPGHYAACFAESLQDLLFADLTGPQRIVSHDYGTTRSCTSRWQGRRDAAHEFTSRPLARACAIALGANLIKVTRRRPS